MAAPTEPPELRLLRGRGLAFGAGSARALRERYHVTGALLGPRPAGSSAHRGSRPGRLPVLLLPEELRLLRESGAVRMRGSGAQDEPEKSPTDPSPQEPSDPPQAPDGSCPSPSACPTHEHRYRVYRDLWGRGLYLTHGGKFGGDFLVYPGPPARFHASALALCLPPGSGLAPGSLVAAARLGTHVRKTLLLCSAGPPGGAPTYTSLQWRADLA